MPRYLETASTSPGFTLFMSGLLSLLTLPRTVVEITILFTASVTSVCPPTISTFSSSAVLVAPFTISFKSSRSADGGIKSVIKTPTGSAHWQLTSFTEIFMASDPRFFEAPVMGSVEATIRSPPKSITALSRPVPPPIITSFLFETSLSKIYFSNKSVFNFPIFILYTSQKFYTYLICISNLLNPFSL